MRKQLIFLFGLVLSLSVEAANISFADSHVKAVCVEQWDTDGDGELSEEEAAMVTDLGHVFVQDTDIKSFDELRFFTSLTSISSSDFKGCNNMVSIQLPPQLKSIGKSAFTSCSRLTAIVIPEGVKTIGDFAFNGCIRLASLNLPEGLTSIGEYSFNDCSALMSLAIPSTLTTIPTNAFMGCSSITSLTVAAGNTVFDSREDCNALIRTSTNTMVLGTTNSTFPSSVVAIGDQAFSGNSKLVSIDIPEGIKNIGESAFSNCSSLVSVALPSSLTTIKLAAFNGCQTLTDVLLREGLKTIEGSAFEQCYGLKRISIPASVKTIEYNAFYQCTSLVEVTVGFSAPLSISSTVFSNRRNATLYVPQGCVPAFQQANYWKEFKSIKEWYASGDVNHDGYVNIFDVTLVIDYILDKNPEGFYVEEADVNADGFINVFDVTLIIDIILQK